MQKTILITGCSSGIGAALAAEFGRRGHRVYATARRIETLAALERDGIRGLELDVNDEASIAGALESAAKGAKPPRAEAWAAAGVARALTAGEVDAAAQALLDKALAVDKANCTARLALAAGGKGEAPADCK